MGQETTISLAPGILWEIGRFPITNTLLMAFGTTLVLSAIAFFFSRAQIKPMGRFRAALELIFEGLLGLMDSITRDRKRTERYAPIVFTIFFFVLTANLVEVLPGVEAVTLERNGRHIPILRSPSSDLNMTFALALIAVVSSHVFGVAAQGVFRHAAKYFSLKNPIAFFIGILELISEFAKVLSFSFRLFGNIFAGGVLLLVVSGIIPLIAPLPFLGLEIFVGLIQALVFSVLALVFISMATETSH